MTDRSVDPDDESTVEGAREEQIAVEGDGPPTLGDPADADEEAAGEPPGPGARATHALFEIDADDLIVTWPSPSRALYGFEQEAMLGEYLTSLFVEDEPAGEPLADILAAAAEETIDLAVKQTRADGEKFWGRLTLTPTWHEGRDGYIVVSQDTTTQRRYQRRLERQNDRLKEFTDIIVHDLRNPLHLIDGRLTLARETCDSEHLAVIEETTARMADLVDDLLEVARQGEFITEREGVDLGDVVETAWESTGATSTGASLDYRPVDGVRGDPDRLCEFFENLFQNSVDHGGDEVTVTVGALPDGFYVADDGPGVPPAKLDDVFDHGVTSTDEGHGYGLSILRTIANAHGWDIHVENDGGARFDVTGVEVDRR